MIIERIQQWLITRVYWTDAQCPRDAETEEGGHLMFDQGLAYRVELTRRQNIEQCRAGDQAMIASPISQEPPQRLDAAVDDHCVVRQRQ
jgi:hypothetical protein